MVEKIKSTLWAFLTFVFALGVMYMESLQSTGSVNKAIERTVIAVVLWVICALLWGTLCALRESLSGPSSFNE